MRNQTGEQIQERVQAAIDNNTNIRNWIANFGGGLYTHQHVISAVEDIRDSWKNSIADIMLPLIAEVLGVCFTVINPDGKTTVIGDGANILLRVNNPVPHYNATKI